MSIKLNYRCRGIKTKLLIAIVLAMLLFAGCNGFSDPNINNTSTDNKSTSISSDDHAANVTTTSFHSTKTSIPTEAKTNDSKLEKYALFRDAYVDSLEDYNVFVINSSLNPDNESLHLTYAMKNPDSNQTSFCERKNISLNYYYVADHFRYNDSRVDEDWIPKRVTVTAVSSDDELIETGYVTYENATQLAEGEISDEEYVIRYYLTIEPGPASPQYED